MAKISLKYPKPKKSEQSLDRAEYPSIYLNDVKLPLDKSDVGETVTAVVTLKLTDYGEDNNMRNKETVRYQLALIDIDIKGTLERNVTKKLKETF